VAAPVVPAAPAEVLAQPDAAPAPAPQQAGGAVRAPAPAAAVPPAAGRVTADAPLPAVDAPIEATVVAPAPTSGARGAAPVTGAPQPAVQAGAPAEPQLETVGSELPDPQVLALGAGFLVAVGGGFGFLVWRRARRG
jgi:hypothetical protein